MKPLLIDLCCGSGGWSAGFAERGWRCVGFDVVNNGYPHNLVLQDVRTLHGKQFKDASLIVASPPCQEFSRWDMPWLRECKRPGSKNPPLPDLSIWRACERIATEAGVPLVIENVKGAQKFLGRSVFNIGSRYLWGDVPILRPDIKTNSKKWTKGNIPPGKNRVVYRSHIEKPISDWLAEMYTKENE
jgi:hypothetical protein